MSADEITAWRESSVIERLDLAFSREPSGPSYVQDVLRAQVEGLRETLGRGGASMSGSHAGMVGAQHATFQLLGPDMLQAW